jgi:lysozyme
MESIKIALSLIIEFEGYREKAYQLAGEKFWTIGYGSTTIDGVPVKQGQLITKEKARIELEKEVIKIKGELKKVVTTHLNAEQEASLISFVYNVGIGSFKASTLLKLLNKGDYKSVPDQLRRWVKGSDGNVMLGLKRRREKEALLFGIKPV